MKKKLLITGFDPFGGETINPSFEAVKRIDRDKLDADVRILEIPTCYGRGAERLLAEIDAFLPDTVLLCGQAGGRARITPEKMAVNFMHASIPDNAGVLKKDEPVIPGGAAALVTNADVLGITEELNRGKDIFAVSYHAGTFVCNDLYYHLLHRMTEEDRAKPQIGLFVHVPFLPEQAKSPDTPCMPLDEIRDGITMIARKLIAAL